MADTIIENLIAKVGFDFDVNEVESFNDAIEFVGKNLSAIVKTAAGAAASIFLFTKAMASANDELGKTAAIAGVDVEALQELGFVADLGGSDLNEMSVALINLNKTASEAARGMGAGVEVFGLLGLSVTDTSGRLKSADALLLEVSDAIAGLGTQAERLEFAQKLGFSDKLLLSIQQGSEAILQQRKEARELNFAIGQDAANAAAKFNDEFLKVQKIISGITNQIGTGLIKQLTPLIELTVDWFKANRDLIQQNISIFLDNTIRFVRGVFNVVFRVIRVIRTLIDVMGGWKTSLIAVGALITALNIKALLLPLLVIGLGAAILLVLEDIITFAQGGDSALGNLADRFEAVDVTLRGIIKLLNTVNDGWNLIFETIRGGNTFLQDVMDTLEELSESFDNVFGPTIRYLDSIIAKGDAAILNLFNVNPAPAPAVGGTVVNKTINNNQSATINTGANAEAVRPVVDSVFNERLRGAEKNLSSNVEY